MHRAAVKLLFAVILLLLAFSASASLTPPPLPHLEDLAIESVADSATACPDRLTWERLESQHAVLAVLILATDPDYGDIRVVVHVVPCDPKNRLYRVFLCRQPPLGLYWGESVVNGIGNGIAWTGRKVGSVTLDVYDTAVTVPAQYYVGKIAGARTADAAFGVGEQFWVGFNVDVISLPGRLLDRLQGSLDTAESFYNPYLNNCLDLDLERSFEQLAFVGGANAHEFRVLTENLKYSAQYFDTWLKYSLAPEAPPLPANTATVMQHPGTPTHFSVSVEGGAHTHQVVTGSTSTRIVTTQTANAGPVLKQAETIVDAASAAVHQTQLLEIANLGPYDKVLNSCVSHVCEVLRAGGMTVPEAQGSAQLRFLLEIIKKSAGGG